MFLPKNVMLLIRSLHIYLSMFALLLVLFFSMTGFMMNHSEFFGIEKTETAESKVTIPHDLLPAEGAATNEIALAAYFHDTLHLMGEPDTAGAGDDPIHLVFKSPRGRDDIEIARATGEATITHTTKSLTGVLSNLHKAADTGSSWKRVVDATAILLVLISLTGLVLWMTLAKRRTLGLISLAVSVVVCAGVLWIIL